MKYTINIQHSLLKILCPVHEKKILSLLILMRNVNLSKCFCHIFLKLYVCLFKSYALGFVRSSCAIMNDSK